MNLILTLVNNANEEVDKKIALNLDAEDMEDVLLGLSDVIDKLDTDMSPEVEGQWRILSASLAEFADIARINISKFKKGDIAQVIRRNSTDYTRTGEVLDVDKEGGTVLVKIIKRIWFHENDLRLR